MPWTIDSDITLELNNMLRVMLDAFASEHKVDYIHVDHWALRQFQEELTRWHGFQCFAEDRPLHSVIGYYLRESFKEVVKASLPEYQERAEEYAGRLKTEEGQTEARENNVAHLAVKAEADSVLQILLTVDITDPDAVRKKRLWLKNKDPGGFTPLHLAVMSDNIPRVEMLLDAGADMNVQNDDGGYSPCHLARNSRMLAFLRDYRPTIEGQDRAFFTLKNGFDYTPNQVLADFKKIDVELNTRRKNQKRYNIDIAQARTDYPKKRYNAKCFAALTVLATAGAIASTLVATDVIGVTAAFLGTAGPAAVMAMAIAFAVSLAALTVFSAYSAMKACANASQTLETLNSLTTKADDNEQNISDLLSCGAIG